MSDATFLPVLPELWRQHDGPLTRELLLAPADFGLGRVPQRRQPDAVTTSTCGYCSTGCGLTVHLRDGAAIGLSPDAAYPVNLGMACPKGWESLTVLNATDRGTTPLLKKDRGRLAPVDWPTALTTFVNRFQAIQAESGPEATAFLSTGQICTEEMALLGALAKFGMGMIHGDGNTRQCMATAVVAYKQSFGFDAPPYTYQDFEESDCLIFVGANPCIAHPILWERVLRNRRNPEIIVVDPRRTETAMQATQHVALKPKSDLDLFYGLAHILIAEGWVDRDYVASHTSGFEAFADFVKDFAPARVAAATGIDVARLYALARTIHERPRVSFWWTMGVNQSHQGVRTAQALINLALMTGNMGRPGTGANSITGQCNAMGSRLFSNTTNLLGGRDFENPSHRDHVADLLRIPADRIPDRNSWAYPEIISGILKGKIKGLWVVATNPAHSWINQGQLLDVFSRLEFLVVQDMYHTTETARLADLYLPAAGWGEKEGTFINSERRIGLVKKVARAPGQALADFSIFKLIADRWGCGELLDEWTSPEAVFQILKRLSAGQPCDITGIADYRMLDEQGGVQWPFPATPPSAQKKTAPTTTGELPSPPEGEGLGMRGSNDQRRPLASSPPLQGGVGGVAPPVTAGTELAQRHVGYTLPTNTHRRLFEDGRFYHADGRARFLFEEPRLTPELPSPAYPLLLLTGRGSVAQWHTQTRTAKSAVLQKLAPQGAYVEISPADARGLAVRQNDLVLVETQRGSIKARAFVTHCVRPGQVFVPMHYETVNQLTDAVFDPYSRQPSYKACAVRVRKTESVP